MPTMQLVEQIIDYKVEVFDFEAYDWAPVCESLHCLNVWHKDSHPADWSVTYSCGHMVNWCQERFHTYVHHDVPKYNGFWCTICAPVGVGSLVRLVDWIQIRS